MSSRGPPWSEGPGAIALVAPPTPLIRPCISAVRHSGTLVTISGVLTAARVRTVLLAN